MSNYYFHCTLADLIHFAVLGSLLSSAAYFSFSRLRNKEYSDTAKGQLTAAALSFWQGICLLVYPVTGAADPILWLAICLVLFLYFLKDLLTFRFRRPWFFCWIVFCLLAGFFIPIESSSRFFGILFSLILLPGVLAGKTGTADLVFSLGIGFLLGLERTLICFLFAVLSGLFYPALLRILRIENDGLIPFVSCLCPGFLVSWACGYHLFALITSLFI